MRPIDWWFILGAFSTIVLVLRWLFKPRQPSGITVTFRWSREYPATFDDVNLFMADGNELSSPHIIAGPGRLMSASSRHSNGIAVRTVYDFHSVGPFDLIWAELMTSADGRVAVMIRRREGTKIA